MEVLENSSENDETCGMFMDFPGFSMIFHDFNGFSMIFHDFNGFSMIFHGE